MLSTWKEIAPISSSHGKYRIRTSLVMEEKNTLLYLVEPVSRSSMSERYPYSRNRVFLSAIIAILSTILALTLIISDIILMLYYFIGTSIVTIITFLLKKRLYLLLVTENRKDETENEMKGSSWKMLLVAFTMLMGFIVIPLLLAGFLDPYLWFIMITSFMSGVSISEIAIYIQSSGEQ